MAAGKACSKETRAAEATSVQASNWAANHGPMRAFKCGASARFTDAAKAPIATAAASRTYMKYRYNQSRLLVRNCDRNLSNAM